MPFMLKAVFRSIRTRSLMTDSGDQETRMTLTGHSSVVVNAGYTHLELPKRKAALEKLPSLGAGH